jgi:anti-sigma factor RsiW
MSPFDPAELSAYLDGELAPDRARQLKAMIASDPGLQAEVEALRQADTAFRNAAGTAAFTPRVRLPATAGDIRPVLAIAALALVLAAVRLAPKLMGSLAFDVALHGIVLAVVLLGVTWMVRREQRTAHA